MRLIGTFLTAVMVSTLALAEEMKTTNRFTPDPRNEEKQSFEGPHVPEILTEEHWKTVVEASMDAPVFVFKHSTQCPVSACAAYRTNKFLTEQAGGGSPKFYYVKVIETRPVSKQIEAETAVKHESPQLLLLDNGKAVWDTSHEHITGNAIKKAVKKHASEGDEAASKKPEKKGYKKY